MNLSQLKKLIKEELEVILTNEEVGDFFGEDVQAKLEEGGGFFEDSAEEEEGEAEEEVVPIDIVPKSSALPVASGSGSGLG